MTSYLIKTSNLGEFYNAIQAAKTPERLTIFCYDFNFTSSNGRLLVGVQRCLGFIDGIGVPQQRYFDILDQINSDRFLAEAIEEAYADLFYILRRYLSVSITTR